MALKTLGETGFAWRTREAFLDAEFEITLSRNGKSTSEKIATEGWNRDKAVAAKRLNWVASAWEGLSLLLSHLCTVVTPSTVLFWVLKG